MIDGSLLKVFYGENGSYYEFNYSDDLLNEIYFGDGLNNKTLKYKFVYDRFKRVKEVLPDIKMDNKTISYIANISNGDIRYAYNLIEFMYYGLNKEITIEGIINTSNTPSFYTDKNEDGYYDTISAFQKSIRGSDVDASLHYLARLIERGDYDIIYRRMSDVVYEDIGLANPMMGVKLNAAINNCERE